MAKLLLAEDDPQNVEILTDLLEEEGHALIVAGNREDAVALAARELPDLILMDMRMPDSSAFSQPKDTSGLEATRELKSKNETRDIPVIALTAHTMLQEREKILEAGCDDLQAKPYDFGRLLACIDRFLEGKSS